MLSKVHSESLQQLHEFPQKQFLGEMLLLGLTETDHSLRLMPLLSELAPHHCE